MASRDRDGEPRCPDCPDTAADPLAELVDLVTRLDPSLDAKTVLDALGRATVRPAGQRRLAWAVVARPDLLTGAGHDAPAPAILRFIDALAGSGASAVVRPACPRCHQVKALSKILDGKRVCRNCFARHSAVPAVTAGPSASPPHAVPTGNRFAPTV